MDEIPLDPKLVSTIGMFVYKYDFESNLATQIFIISKRSIDKHKELCYLQVDSDVRKASILVV